jgi:hypothetical protein
MRSGIYCRLPSSTASSPAILELGHSFRHCPDLTEILRCARAGPPAADGIEELWKEGHVPARAHREYQTTLGHYKVELADVRWNADPNAASSNFATTGNIGEECIC